MTKPLKPPPRRADDGTKEKKPRVKDKDRNPPPPNTPAQREAQAARLLQGIHNKIVEGRSGVPLSVIDQAELDQDLDLLKRKFRAWSTIETKPATSLSGLKKQLGALDQAVTAVINCLQEDLDPITSSLLINSLDGDHPLLEDCANIGGVADPGNPANVELDLRLDWWAISWDDDPTQTSHRGYVEKQNLVKNLLSFQKGIERTLRRVAPLKIKRQSDLFTALYGGVSGQLALECHRLLVKHSGCNPMPALHAGLLEVLYPWVANLLDGTDFERWATDAEANFRGYMTSLVARERALDRCLSMLEDGSDEDGDLFGSAGRTYLRQVATELVPLASMMFRAPDGEPLPPTTVFPDPTPHED